MLAAAKFIKLNTNKSGAPKATTTTTKALLLSIVVTRRNGPRIFVCKV
jgi:hypothetical protein